MKGDESIISDVLFIILIARFPSQARLENPSSFSVYRVRSLSKQLIASAAHLRALVFSEENRTPFLGDVSSISLQAPHRKGARRKREDHSHSTKKKRKKHNQVFIRSCAPPPYSQIAHVHVFSLPSLVTFSDASYIHARANITKRLRAPENNLLTTLFRTSAS